jgi:hypothetical protein
MGRFKTKSRGPQTPVIVAACREAALSTSSNDFILNVMNAISM